MRSYEIEALEAGKAHGTVREEADTASPDLAARAAVAGRTEALAPAAVLRLQRAAGNAGVAAALENEQESPVKDVVGKGSGQPLEAPVRQRMEASFGADFSDVRVHSGGSAAASAQAVDAHAYTVGNEIVLGDGQTPGSPSHERTLAHELTHVVQQRSGPVDGTPTGGGISVSDPADRFERAAEATADSVVSTGRAPDAGAAGAGASVQREGPEEEEEAQLLAIQRQDIPEEEEAQLLAIQRQETPEEEEDEAMQALAIQRQEMPEEEEEAMQALAIQRIQREEAEGRLLL
ncbi:MAG: DUF4157 domain-containing protein [Chloroflexota bacterium]